jgi:hypothetical protein
LSFLKISVASRRCWFSKILLLLVLVEKRLCTTMLHILLSVPSQKWQVQNERHPISVDEEEDSQEGVYGSFRDDVGVEAVAQIDRVDVVAVARLDWPVLRVLSALTGDRMHSPFQIAVHDGEEHLEEEVDGVYQHRQ